MLGQIDSARADRCVLTAIVVASLSLGKSPAVARADEPSPATGALAARSAVIDGAANLSPSAAAQQERIRKLILDLGNPRYTARRAAAAELRQIGPEAFDLLHAATEDADPEIAASANYLLRQIAVRWVRTNDPAAVREILGQYGREAESARLQRVQQLAKLSRGAGMSGLCRIARFDRSSLVSRAAALAIIRPDDADADRSHVDPELVEAELGASTRTSVTWLRQYLAQLHDPPASIAAWKQLIDEEQARLKRNKSETSNEILLGLLWNLADVYRQAGDQAALAGALDEMMDLAIERLDETAIGLIEWLVGNKSWSALDTFLSKHQSRFQHSKRPLYFAAIARAKQGKTEEAEQLAKSAAGLQSQPNESLFAAVQLEQRGQYEWAVREYRTSIDKGKKETADSSEAIRARILLSNLLHDHERHKEAADTLEPLVKSVQGEGRVGQLYARLRDYYTELPDPDVIPARFHFYRAEQYLAEKDTTRARSELDLAINFDPEDADVLIAMYRFPEADAKWQDSVRQRIRQLADEFQQKIDQDPSNATNYNQWAWLVSNTEGDFQKAIRYSHRSLDLNANGESGEASYLDTLGRCYYAAGDYENAVKYERQAIEKVDHMQVMQRQMALFEEALAEKKAGGVEQGAGSKKK